MHELSVSAAIVDTAVKHAAGRKVLLVSVRLGHLRQVVPDSLAFYFDLCSRDTVCEGASLEYEVVPAVLRCEPCAREWAVSEPAFRCPTCDGARVVTVSGEELEVASIEVEEEEPACTV
jgi:hydrogenase nickel incorporation protein HypA/HybF